MVSPNMVSRGTLTAIVLAALTATAGSGAAAQNGAFSQAPDRSAATRTAADTAAYPSTQPLAADTRPAVEPDPAIQPLTPDQALPAAVAAASLEELVAAQDVVTPVSAEMRCLAGAIYYEARSETLRGQLAVGRVVVARTRSGRFPASYCGVIHQPAQFPWARRVHLDDLDGQSPMWQRAVAVARIADAGSWQSPAEGALFFHAGHTVPRANATGVMQVDHQVFYR